MHAAIKDGNVAVVTGGASGLGLAIVRRLQAEGLRVCVADLPGEALNALDDVLAVPTDVSDADAFLTLKSRVEAELGQVQVLFNNAGIGMRSSALDGEAWARTLDVNMWGVIRGAQTFGPDMAHSGAPGLIVNTGSKQGITTPPGNPAYNVSKAGVRVFTEALQHELRNIEGCQTEARLFVPGFVYTSMISRFVPEKPAAAWTSEETVEFLFEALARDTFYILCPDNDVTRDTDNKRIAWNVQDVIEDRPPLSRWHPEFSDAFEAYMKGE